jgi:hypothetical protein
MRTLVSGRTGMMVVSMISVIVTIVGVMVVPSVPTVPISISTVTPPGIPVAIAVPGVPARPVAAIPPGREGDTHREPPEEPGNEPCAIAPAKAPVAVERVVDRGKSPRQRRRVVSGSDPSRVGVPRSIDDGVPVDVGAEIPGCVTHIHDFRGRVIDSDIFHIVDRTFRRNGVNLGWDFVSNNPWPCRAVGDKPDSLVHRVILVFDLDHLGFRVHGVLHVRAFDGLELGIAVVGNRKLGLVPFNCRGLRDLSVQHRLLGLSRSRNECEDVALRRPGRYVLEVLREIF